MTHDDYIYEEELRIKLQQCLDGLIGIRFVDVPDIRPPYDVRSVCKNFSFNFSDVPRYNACQVYCLYNTPVKHKSWLCSVEYRNDEWEVVTSDVTNIDKIQNKILKKLLKNDTDLLLDL